MPGLAVDRDRLRTRYDMYPANHYLGLHNVVVSLALAVAGLAAASLLGLPESYRSYVPLLWLMTVASLLGIAVAYAGTVTGAPILPPRVPAVLDLVLPLLLGLSEFFLFGVLARQVTALNSPKAVTVARFVASAVFGALAALSVVRARSVIVRGDYAVEIRAVVASYVRRLRSDALAAAAVGLVGALAAVGAGVGPASVSWLDYVAVGLMITGFGGGFYSHARTRRSFHAVMD